MIKRNDICKAAGDELDLLMGKLQRGTKTDADFRYDVLETFRRVHIIDPETYQVNHPLGIGQRIMVQGLRNGRICGTTYRIERDPKGNPIYAYLVQFDDGARFDVDHYWVWPLDDNDNMMSALT